MQAIRRSKNSFESYEVEHGTRPHESLHHTLLVRWLASVRPNEMLTSPCHTARVR